MMSLIKNVQFRFLMAGLVVLGTLGFAGIVTARGGYGDGGGLPLRMLWGLDLSAEQKTAIHNSKLTRWETYALADARSDGQARRWG